MAGAARTKGEEEQQRNQLFSGAGAAPAPRGGDGAGPSRAAPAAAADEPEPTTEQMVHQAVATHKDSTQIANRALRVITRRGGLQSVFLGGERAVAGCSGSSG